MASVQAQVSNCHGPGAASGFELRDVQPLTYIVGPLGSGKTRLAMLLAEKLPQAVFLALNRLEDARLSPSQGQRADTPLTRRVARTLAWMKDDGASSSEALAVLLTALEADGPGALVIDMVEQGLDQATQEVLMTHLRRKARAGARPLFLLTRSSAILDLQTAGPGEAIIFCPANHSVPLLVAPYPGVAAYEAVRTCLASPEVRARTAGMMASMPAIRPEATVT